MRDVGSLGKTEKPQNQLWRTVNSAFDCLRSWDRLQGLVTIRSYNRALVFIPWYLGNFSCSICSSWTRLSAFGRVIQCKKFARDEKNDCRKFAGDLKVAFCNRFLHVSHSFYSDHIYLLGWRSKKEDVWLDTEKLSFQRMFTWKKTLWLVRNPTMGLSQPLIHVVQNRNDALGLSEKTTLFVFSQCVSCSPAWWFCTAWGTDCKEPFSLLCLLLNLLFVGSTTL